MHQKQKPCTVMSSPVNPQGKYGSFTCISRWGQSNQGQDLGSSKLNLVFILGPEKKCMLDLRNCTHDRGLEAEYEAGVAAEDHDTGEKHEAWLRADVRGLQDMPERQVQHSES
jgi:hypothetical protein